MIVRYLFRLMWWRYGILTLWLIFFFGYLYKNNYLFDDIAKNIDKIIAIFWWYIALITFIYNANSNNNQKNNSEKPFLRPYDFHWNKIPQNHSEKTCWFIVYCGNKTCKDIHICNVRHESWSDITIKNIYIKENKDYIRNRITNNIEHIWSTINKWSDIEINLWLKYCNFLFFDKEFVKNADINIYISYRYNKSSYINQKFTMTITNNNEFEKFLGENIKNNWFYIQAPKVDNYIYSIIQFDWESRSFDELWYLELIKSLRLKILYWLNIRENLSDKERLMIF